ncbi:N-acetyltransferase [Enterobacter bugandensis]|uniref:N-acetyltransferase n=1 Tax=Enterobacter bugandensis TaxID=881260 RepID=UPI00207578B5|nr:N-acetyltransferase [Enterobacter bugandensis]MCM7239184.1 N-acetyltransferase [Enterobacter bugandensis]MCM7319117.1 N-acetyltransferase [Enterobacter bugandensis]MCM7354556.1 N-acetyltransferase [Enterobacter bugandensis]
MRCREAKLSEIDSVCDLLTIEFFNDPVLKYAFIDVDIEKRKKNMRFFFEVYTRLAKQKGGILITEGITGALIYFNPTFLEMTKEERMIIDTQLRNGCGDDYDSISYFMNGLDLFHPINPPHIYIFLVAVSRPCRGGEVVSTLFKEINRILDASNLPCYAECTTFTTRTLLRRYGYYDAGKPLFIDGFPHLYPIWRNPMNKK